MKWLPIRFAAAPLLTDEQAMLEVQSRGDHDAFAQLVERWQQPIRRLCMRMTGNEHRGEDLTQETFARVFASRHQYTNGRKFSTWMWRIALNLCYEEGRRTSQRRESLFDPSGDSCGALVGIVGRPEEQAIDRERASLVRKALNGLSDQQRSIVVLREYEGLKYREIAELLELPEGTVKWRMAEALSQLGKLLEPLAPDGGPDSDGTEQVMNPRCV
jgi:RNA polymerase sigma-70 factor, ECF subfamily